MSQFDSYVGQADREVNARNICREYRQTSLVSNPKFFLTVLQLPVHTQHSKSVHRVPEAERGTNCCCHRSGSSIPNPNPGCCCCCSWLISSSSSSSRAPFVCGAPARVSLTLLPLLFSFFFLIFSCKSASNGETLHEVPDPEPSSLIESQSRGCPFPLSGENGQ